MGRGNATLGAPTTQEVVVLPANATPREWLTTKVWSPIDKATAPLASSRSVLVVMGLFALWTAHTTRVAYTPQELRTRDICVIALWAAAIIGLAHIFVRPNRASMAVFGFLLMLNAALRMAGFGDRTWHSMDWSGPPWADCWHFVEGSNALPVWGAIGYFGFLIWRRRNHVTTTHDVSGRGG